MAPFSPAKNIATLLYKMGVDYYTCEFCKEIFNDCGNYNRCQNCRRMMCEDCGEQMIGDFGEDNCEEKRKEKNEDPHEIGHFCKYGICGEPKSCFRCDEEYLKDELEENRNDIEKSIDNILKKNEDKSTSGNKIADVDFIKKMKEYVTKYKVLVLTEIN